MQPMPRPASDPRSETDAASRSDRATPRRFAFVLVEGFPLLSFASAVDTLRIANRLGASPPYGWRVLTETGAPVRAACGTQLAPDAGLGEPLRDEAVAVVSGADVQHRAGRALLAWLRLAARMVAPVGGLCTGAWALAQAGLLDGRTATIHWENRDGFREAFGEVRLSGARHVAEADRFTTAGCSSALDLMLGFVAGRHGEALAAAVADQLIHNPLRIDSADHEFSAAARLGLRHPRLAKVIETMEAHLEDPVSPAVLAREVGLSTRQLERLFRRHLNRSPKRYYMELRLRKARHLLAQTDMSVIHVALACGFASPSHFSRCYRAQFQTTPYRDRAGPGRRLPS